MIQVICFKHFWTNVSKLAGESMIKNLNQLRPVKFLGLVSVMVLMTTFVDEMILRCRSCLCQESSILNPVAGNLPKLDCTLTNISIYRRLLRTH